MALTSADWLKQSVGLFRKKAAVVQTLAASDPSDASVANAPHGAQQLAHAGKKLGKPAVKAAASNETANTAAHTIANTTAPTKRTTFVRLASKTALPQEALKPKALADLLAQLQAVVNPTLSEVEGGQKAQAVAQWYHSASADQRRDCWQLMSEQFGIDTAQLSAATQWLAPSHTGSDTVQAGTAWLQEAQLRKALRCSRTQLIQRFAVFTDGIRFLVQLRAEMLTHLAKHPQDKLLFAALDSELETLFATWFDVAFLELTRISWNSPAALIEKLIQYEAVHDIQSWDDVKNRLDSDRRCYGFFHPRLPGEPLIFVEVAFTQDIADNMAPILDDRAASTDVSKAKTANFYSISNTQPGLKGVGFGDSLIKKVVHALQQELPHIKTFTTLSPIPSFRAWLNTHAAGMLALTPSKLLKTLQAQYAVPVASTPPSTPAAAAVLDAATLLTALNGLMQRLHAGRGNSQSAAVPAAQAAQTKRSAVATDPDAALKQWLLGAIAHYLSHEMQRGLPADPVAKFHLGNGATLARLNWAADVSAKGVQQSYGVMVNYVYDLKRLDKNRLQLQQKGAVAVLPAVQNLSL